VHLQLGGCLHRLLDQVLESWIKNARDDGLVFFADNGISMLWFKLSYAGFKFVHAIVQDRLDSGVHKL